MTTCLVLCIILITLLIPVVVYASALKRTVIRLKKKQSRLEDKQREATQVIDEFKKKEKSMDQFFAIVTHDLRGPVGNTGSILQTLIENPEIYNPETQHEILSALKDSAKQSLELLDTLSQWSRIQRKKVQINLEPFSVQDAIDIVIERIKERALAKNISIEINRKKTEILLNSDISLITIMLQHLMVNAIKYSYPRSKIILTVDETEEGVQFSIEDDGSGIEKENFSRILDTTDYYYTYGTADEKGPGLGITIVQEYCKLINGKLWFESKKEEGSTFFLQLENSTVKKQ
ncbi:MAG TPA: HAMP domain-containing sensor histidine kinase [Bacteroidales bacterium]|nr:HAMP domain-containing sensor histidine kinase [Bacteroidales bacterium]